MINVPLNKRLVNIPRTLLHFGRIWLGIPESKVPQTLEKLSKSRPAMWSDDSELLSWMEAGSATVGFCGQWWDALGFKLTEDLELTYIDIDNCRNPYSGEIYPEIEDLIQELGTYTEISSSGCGLHLLLRRDRWTQQGIYLLPEKRAAWQDDPLVNYRFGNGRGIRIEVYTENRVATLTGWKLQGGGVDSEPQDTMHLFRQWVARVGATVQQVLRPEEVERLIETAQEKGKVPNLLNTVQQGNRNNTLAYLAKVLYRSGRDKEEVEAILQEQNRLYCVPPMSEHEVSGIAASMGRTLERRAERERAEEEARQARYEAELDQIFGMVGIGTQGWITQVGSRAADNQPIQVYPPTPVPSPSSGYNDPRTNNSHQEDGGSRTNRRHRERGGVENSNSNKRKELPCYSRYEAYEDRRSQEAIRRYRLTMECKYPGRPCRGTTLSVYGLIGKADGHRHIVGNRLYCRDYTCIRCGCRRLGLWHCWLLRQTRHLEGVWHQQFSREEWRRVKAAGRQRLKRNDATYRYWLTVRDTREMVDILSTSPFCPKGTENAPKFIKFQDLDEVLFELLVHIAPEREESGQHISDGSPEWGCPTIGRAQSTEDYEFLGIGISPDAAIQALSQHGIAAIGEYPDSTGQEPPATTPNRGKATLRWEDLPEVPIEYRALTPEEFHQVHQNEIYTRMAEEAAADPTSYEFWNAPSSRRRQERWHWAVRIPVANDLELQRIKNLLRLKKRSGTLPPNNWTPDMQRALVEALGESEGS